METNSTGCVSLGGCSWCVGKLGLLGYCWEGAACPEYEDQKYSRQLFASFKEKYSKTYDHDREEEWRFGVFCDNLKRIEQDNADSEDGAEYGITRWTDRTHEELRLKCGGTCVGPNCTRLTARRGVKGNAHAWDGTCYAKPRFPELCTNNTLPEEFDWTAKGAVTAIKDQGNCGNCFTFGATSDMEAAWYLAGNDLVSLSEQQLTSCDRVGGDAGCGGGDSDLDTDEYVQKNGLNSEANYPYCSGHHKCAGTTKKEKKNGICDKKKEGAPVAKFKGGYQISGGLRKCDWCNRQPIDENLMKKHIVRAGPITIGQSEGLTLTRSFHPWGREARGAWADFQVSVSRVVRPRQAQAQKWP